MNKAIITTLIGGAIVGGGMIYSQSRESGNENHSIITLQGVNSSGVEQSLTFDHNSCSYSDSTGIAVDGQANSSLAEETCMLGLEPNLTESQFSCALELCKNTP